MRTAMRCVPLMLLAACSGRVVMVDPGVGSDVGAPGSDAGSAGSDAGVQRIQAVLDRPCDDRRRIGVVEVSDEFGPYSLNASLADAPPPWLGPPASTTAQCAFYLAAMNPGCQCAPEVCDFEGRCVRAPEAIAGYVIHVSGPHSQQSFTGDASGSTFGDIAGATPPLTIEVTGPGFVISAPPMEMPPPLTNLRGTLGGTYDAPTSIDVSWAAPASGHVFTHIPINHHVGGGTFTECLVLGSQGSFHVDEPMLRPLAVATGLEFQGVEAVRFASAELAEGCVELRFLHRYLLNLF